LKRNIDTPHHSRGGSQKTSSFDKIIQQSLRGEFVKSFVLSNGSHPRVVCASDQQLEDVQNYCGEQSVILQIDPTFKLGQFLFSDILPYMLHATREYKDYKYFGLNLST
jgi:hypothetical protein